MKDELIAIVANTLGIDVKNVPYDSTLMSIGLHSLALMSIAEQLTKKYDKNIKFSLLMKNPTIKSWESLIDKLD